MEFNGVEIDEEKAKRILNRVIIEEAKNVKTKQYSSTEMVKKIQKMIEEEIECY